VPGPLDVIEPGVTGVLHEDLRRAVAAALQLDRAACVRAASGFSWQAATNQFLSGLAPIFEAEGEDLVPGTAELVPVWRPWPGESVTLAITRPEAIAGATITVSRVTHEITLGKRQRTSELDLSLRCSLGEDFLVQLPANAECKN